MAKATETQCPHCRANTLSGKHNGCAKCGKVKHSMNGRILRGGTSVAAGNLTRRGEQV